ncbi:MAG: response regulator [Spirochaetes bacterium]|nr:response regulator [Spirochaetota bacterium]MBU1080177.1 response regulator [Spirochaetota bacterium]
MSERARDGGKPEAVILAIDDTPSILDFIRSVLEPEGFSVCVATNGARGLERARRLRPDIVLLDVMMPDLDGYSVCAALKSDPATAGAPVIFLSAMASGLDIAKAFSVGAADYMTKPVEPVEILARVRVHLAALELARIKDLQTERLAAMVEDRTVALRSALKERDAYLREVNHRVKNNLQLIASIIGHQMLADSSAAAILGKLLGRVESFARAYDQLWTSRRLDGIHMGEYLRTVVATTLAMRDGSPVEASIDVDADPFSLDVALPCGLIVHELVSNSARHAFGDEGGAIRVSIAPDGDAYLLGYEDDGRGCQDALADAPGLGIKFINALSGQLGASITLSGSDGFKAALRFKKPERPKDVSLA